MEKDVYKSKYLLKATGRYVDKPNKKYIELLSKEFYPLDKFYDELKDTANYKER